MELKRPSCNPVNNKMSTFRSYLYGIKTRAGSRQEQSWSSLSDLTYMELKQLNVIENERAIWCLPFRSYLYGIKTWRALCFWHLLMLPFRSYLYGIKTRRVPPSRQTASYAFRSYLYGIKTDQLLFFFFAPFLVMLSDLTYMMELKLGLGRNCIHCPIGFPILPIWN